MAAISRREAASSSVRPPSASAGPACALVVRVGWAARRPFGPHPAKPGTRPARAARGNTNLQLPKLVGSYVTQSPVDVASHEPEGPYWPSPAAATWVGTPKLRVIPGECRVEGRRLMIICPYPFCSANWKSCPVLVQVAFEAARCKAQCVDVR